MKKRINLLLIILSVLFVFSTVAFSVNFVYAGERLDTIMFDDFSTKDLQPTNWYSSNNYDGTSFISDDNPKLIVKNGAGASQMLSINAVDCQSLVMKIDVNQLVFGEKGYDAGYFGVAYNLESRSDTVYDAQQNQKKNSDGVFFTALKGEGLVFASMKGGATTFYDGNGDLIPQRTVYNFYDANALLTEDENLIKIENKTIYFCFNNKGDLAVKVKDLDSVSEPKTVITTSESLRPLTKNTYTGICFVEGGEKKLSLADFKDVEIYTDDATPVKQYNCFNQSNINNWDIFKSSLTDEMFFGYNASLLLGNRFSSKYPLCIYKEIKFNDVTDSHQSYALLNSSLKVENIANGSQIGYLFGINKLSKASYGDKDTSFIYFTKSSDRVYCSCDTFYEKDVSTSIFKDVEVFENEKGYLGLTVKITNKGVLTVSCSNEEVYAEATENKAFALRYCALALNGSSTGLRVHVKDVSIINKFYDRPVNSEINETFEDGGYNVNEWNLMYTPYLDTYTNTAYVNDGKLFFENCAMNSAFQTRKQYSDFEMQFDIVDLRREVVGAGVSKSFPISSWIGVYWGVTDEYHKFGTGVTTSFPLVYIEAPVNQKTWDRDRDESGNIIPVTVRAMGNGLNNSWQLSDKYDFWDKKNSDKVLQMKVTVIGKEVSIAVKYTTENEWCTVDRTGKELKSDMDASLTGNVALCTMGCNYYVKEISEGASCGYFSVDNIKLSNKDDNPNTITVEYLSSKTQQPSDYVYTKQDDDSEYLPKSNSEASGCGSSLRVNVASSSVLLLIAVAVLLRRRKDNV